MELALTIILSKAMKWKSPDKEWSLYLVKALIVKGIIATLSLDITNLKRWEYIQLSKQML